MTPPPMYSSPPIVGSSFNEKRGINYSTTDLESPSKDEEEQEPVYDPEMAIRKHRPSKFIQIWQDFNSLGLIHHKKSMVFPP